MLRIFAVLGKHRSSKNSIAPVVSHNAQGLQQTVPKKSPCGWSRRYHSLGNINASLRHCPHCHWTRWRIMFHHWRIPSLDCQSICLQIAVCRT